jgi:PilZ domain
MGLPRFSAFPFERRNSLREPQNYIVRLKFDDDGPWLRAMLNNLSVGGACLSLSATKTIPTEFILVLPPNVSRRCRPVWRSGDRVGVEFLDSDIFEN